MGQPSSISTTSRHPWVDGCTVLGGAASPLVIRSLAKQHFVDCIVAIRQSAQCVADTASVLKVSASEWTILP
ncbi:MAG TPA: hypothetical protein ACQGQN_08420 [Xylella fastidiosa subsp. fastidiosa]|uniref:hypothetical protein n=1 Tax=Xylella fastidiosa TaxID=2371 RepID=UPI000AA824DE|nr:hypothetical protein [Xylella fastidiosa]MBE0261816.1 hypothetical protein [Xylella fastidiosa subsp. fastidiosa]NBI39445.1 hypothetical protein [Xylella fastidiosa subsp. fastidiosa]TWP36430.1 hypothetical protein FNS29_07070 [Xylella fastidiosa subsp. fastidiosa]TWP41123.1 hypothetical protein FNS27_00820 [Xylella fastidiosa subsp. fastidiosa]